ncbi:MAG: hypothetical protein PWP52_1835 [Bacteroidales bacterium]|nr:hypothetical protein [Bacteroidales bacterium]
MKKNNLFFGCLTVIVIALISCENESDTTPELYGEYLTVEINSINDNVEDTVFQIQIFNSQDKVFEKDCNLIFTLTDESLENVYTAEENVVNKRIPDDPSLGYLNLQSGGQFSMVSNINLLDWTVNNLNNIATGDYILQVTLFIDDPSTPNNLIHSNKLSFRKI